MSAKRIILAGFPASLGVGVWSHGAGAALLIVTALAFFLHGVFASTADPKWPHGR